MLWDPFWGMVTKHLTAELSGWLHITPTITAGMLSAGVQLGKKFHIPTFAQERGDCLLLFIYKLRGLSFSRMKIIHSPYCRRSCQTSWDLRKFLNSWCIQIEYKPFHVKCAFRYTEIKTYQHVHAGWLARLTHYLSDALYSSHKRLSKTTNSMI